VLASALAAPLVVAGCWWLGVSLFAALAASVLVAADPRFVLGSNILTPHPLYALLAIAFLFCTSAYLEQPTERRKIAAIAMFGAAFATLELSPLLAVAAVSSAVVCWWSGTTPVRLRHFTIRDVAILVAVLFIAWPAGFLRLGYATCYGVFALLGTARRSEYYGDADLLTIYGRLFGSNPFLLLCALASLTASIWAWWRTRSPLITVCGVYALLAFGFNALSMFRNATYAFEATVFGWVLLAPAIDTAWRCRSSRASTRALVPAETSHT
jgi:hypothetical protein